MNDVTATQAAPPRWRQSLELWGRLTARGLIVLLLPLIAVVYGLFEAFALFATSQGPEAGYPLSLYFAIFFLPGLGSLLALGLFLGPLLLWRSKAAFAPFGWHGQSWRWAMRPSPRPCRGARRFLYGGATPGAGPFWPPWHCCSFYCPAASDPTRALIRWPPPSAC